MAEAEPVIRAALPDANVPTSVRSTGIPVVHGARRRAARRSLDAWLAEHDDGIACVIARDVDGVRSGRIRASVRSLRELAKGLEFDLVVLVDPETFGDGHRGGRRPLRGDDAGDAATRHPDERRVADRASLGRADASAARSPGRTCGIALERAEPVGDGEGCLVVDDRAP